MKTKEERIDYFEELIVEFEADIRDYLEEIKQIEEVIEIYRNAIDHIKKEKIESNILMLFVKKRMEKCKLNRNMAFAVGNKQLGEEWMHVYNELGTISKEIESMEEERGNFSRISNPSGENRRGEETIAKEIKILQLKNSLGRGTITKKEFKKYSKEIEEEPVLGRMKK
jgi:hypothetical protein